MNSANRKKKQHYVFQAYLKPWCNKKQIWCLRNGEAFSSNLEGVACERFFYRAYPLTEEEKNFVSKVMIEVEGTPQPLKAILHRTLDTYCLAHKVKATIESSERTREYEKVLDRLIERGTEDWLARLEDDFLPYLEQMRDGKTEFYEDAKHATVFLLGLCVQSARTKRVREAALRVMGTDIRGRNTLHMLSAVSLLLPIRLSHNLFADRKSFKLEIIENESDTPFITTDQPVINTHGDANPECKPPERMEFFYPLSPNRAMVFLEKDTTVSLRIGGIAANSYNVTMAQHSHEQIFCNSKQYLDTFRNVVGGVGSGNRLRSW